MALISIVDYGLGNIGSVLNMLRRAGMDARLASSPADLVIASAILLPGVGSFDHGMQRLDNLGFSDEIRRAAVDRHIPVLGICLGMQLLLSGSEEGRRHGLGLIPGRAHRFQLPSQSKLKIPHMGWSVIRTKQTHPLLESLEHDARFYFVHSYHAICQSSQHILATASHGMEFAAVIGRDNVVGAQFHPEKSHRYGLQFLKNFSKLTV